MIGIYGGAFDPIHVAHLRVAIETRDALGLREVRLIPTGQPGHRAPARASGRDRARMLELALAGVDGLRVDPRELQRGGISYTVDTLAEISAEVTEPLCLIVGADAFLGLTGWHRWERIFDTVHVAVVPRPGVADDTLVDVAQLAERRADGSDRIRVGQWSLIDATRLAVASRDLRARIAAGKSIRFLTPDPVIDYIAEQRLYRSASETRHEKPVQ